MKMKFLALLAAALLCTGCPKSTPASTSDDNAPASAPAPADAAPADATPAPDPVVPTDVQVPDAIPDTTTLPPPPEPQVDGGTNGRDSAPPPHASIAVGEPNPGAPGVVNASCHTDADCTIKDVGSCCGYRPQCVNKSSPTFPEQVKAACAQDGRMGICGFPAITGCTCTAGRCEGTGADARDEVH
ncbi:MAG: hypothetical protein ACREO3_04770 [Arenimonas sp.]